MWTRSPRAVSVVVLGSFVLLGIAAAALLWALARMDDASALVTHTYEVIARSDEVLLNAEDAEIGYRGYLLTGDTQHLQSYRRAAAELPRDVADLRHLIADNPRQQERLAAIEALLSQRMRILADSLALTERGERGRAAALVGAGVGMDEIRSETAAFGAEERRLLRVREGSYVERQRLVVLGAIVAVVMAVFAGAVTALRLLRRGQQTETRLAETASQLDARISELRATYDTAPIGLAYLDRDLRFVAVNRRLARMYGRTVSAMVGLPLREALPEVADEVEPVYRRVLENGEPLLDNALHCPAPAAGDLAREYLASYWPVRDRHGRVTGVNAAMLDVTERKRAEEDLRRLADTLDAQVAQRTAELTSANEQLEAFAYTVSHDLRAPLRGMEGFARILLDDYGEKLGPEARRYIGRIVAAAERMERLIGDLLTYSRLQRAQIRLRPVDPAPIVRAAAEDARAGTPDPAAVEIAIEEPLPEVVAEPVVLGQVVLNLLTNAVKFHQPDKHAVVRIRGTCVHGRARLCVEDTGIGIAPEHLDRIFTVFERLHGQEAFPGTGIGLAIVKTGVERMGGAVSVESREGEGARFWIDLRAA
ncbi:MAG: sensor histidine kinase [Gemmatimonas sp.]